MTRVASRAVVEKEDVEFILSEELVEVAVEAARKRRFSNRTQLLSHEEVVQQHLLPHLWRVLAEVVYKRDKPAWDGNLYVGRFRQLGGQTIRANCLGICFRVVKVWKYGGKWKIKLEYVSKYGVRKKAWGEKKWKRR